MQPAALERTYDNHSCCCCIHCTCRIAICLLPRRTHTRVLPPTPHPQGVFVKRHQVGREDGSGRLGPADLAVGKTVTVYGRTFILVDADAFTRAWYAQQLGVELGPAGAYPVNPADEYRKRFAIMGTAPGAGARQQQCGSGAAHSCMHAAGAAGVHEGRRARPLTLHPRRARQVPRATTLPRWPRRAWASPATCCRETG